jgi:hypothetical protein
MQEKVIKKVVETNLQAYPLIVYDCPLNKRIWKSGSKIGKSYACVFEDCYKCIFGEVVCDKKSFNNGTTIIDGKIREVHCSAGM